MNFILSYLSEITMTEFNLFLTHKELFGILAGLVSFFAYIPYILSIIKKETKPSRSSWWIWSLVGLMILFSYYSLGARSTIWIPVVFFFCPFLVALLSFKFGEGKNLNYLDKIYFVGAIFSMFAWLVFKSAEIAFFINIFIDFLGFLPTFKKTFLNPSYENKTSWTLFLIGSILNLMAIEVLLPSIVLYPIYMFIMDIIMLCLIFRKK